MANMTYRDQGVDYDAMDPYKRKAQQVAQTTAHFLERLGCSEVTWSRGESAHITKTPWGVFIAFVVEGLGTKNKVAVTMRWLAKKMNQLTGKTYYDKVNQCNVAMVVNDLATSGASVGVYGQYLGVGSSSWFDDDDRARDTIRGTMNGCTLARATWGCGETPTLKGIIDPETPDLAGAAWGIITSEDRLINPANIADGDAIVMIESSGIHANGLTLCRAIGDRKDPWWRKLLHWLMPERFPLQALPNGYLTKLLDGRTYGETLLDPTHIYAGLVEDCLNLGVRIHYAVNITGHGWRKLMRAIQSFAYIIDTLPSMKLIFPFLQEHGPVDDYEAYGNLNMGAGFALYVPEVDVATIIEIAKGLGLVAFRAGHIEKSDTKKVIIKPKGLVYTGDTLAVR
jgi:phosphoribosylformylglycinamidine cyclo-ligase